MEDQPTIVPSVATQAGDVRSRWPWAEPAVWTDRMLTALERGVKGGVWFSLIDKVASEANLRAAIQKVASNRGSPGVDHITITEFLKRAPEEADSLHRSLMDGTYRPQAIRRTYIDKLGSKEQRPLGIPTVRDRTVQAALRNVLEPIFEKTFAEHSYGFRPQRGCRDALRRVDHLLKAGYTFVVDADIKGYFDNIPREPLLVRVREQIADGRVLALLEAFLTQPILEDLKTWTPERGTPQGAVVSPLLANIYLNPLDHRLAEDGYEMVRYADDFVVLCRSNAEARQALEAVRAWTEAAGLQLHPTKTCIVDMAVPGGFDFLGYHFERGKRDPSKIHHWPRAKSLRKMKDTIRRYTKRCNGRSLEAIIAQLNPVLRGWFGYFKHSPKPTFPRLDGWIRMRLRSILRKRHKRRGAGRGWDHKRWPNKYFAAQGLLSLAAAHVAVRQSPRG